MRGSNSVALVVGIFVVSCALAGPASARKTTCTYQGYNDGCTNAPGDGNYINSDFFSYAKQSGQGSYYSAPNVQSDHPPPWNVAGVDYPVGYSLHRAGGPLKDPATATLPSGCKYSPTGSLDGGPAVTCSGVNDLTFNGWDFSLHNCTYLDIASNVTGTISITNSKFVNGSNCAVDNGNLVKVENQASANFRFEHNYVDGDAQNFPNPLVNLVTAYVHGRLNVKYNAFLNSPAQPVGSDDTGPTVFEFNYWEGWVYQAADGHGEVAENYVGDNKTQNLIRYSFNTGLEPNTVCQCGTSVWYPIADGDNNLVQKVVVDHNTSIVNLDDGQVTVSVAAAELSGTTFGSVTFNQNYMDPTGSWYCFASMGNPNYQTTPQFTGNVNMVDGQTVTGFGSCP